MPNRIIKESAFTSERISALSDFAFRLWVGLITQADDTGRGDARPAIIKGRVFALRERVSMRDIDNALRALAAGGCIQLYQVDGRPYYQFPHWSTHQRVRNVVSKFPAPGDENDEAPQDAANCGELPQGAAERGLNPIQSNTESNPYTNPYDVTASQRSRFQAPSLEEVAAYCKERGNGIDPQHFIDHYSSNGWKVGKNPMRDWKAAVRTWERNGYDRKPTGNKVVASRWNTEEDAEKQKQDLLRVERYLKEGKI